MNLTIVVGQGALLGVEAKTRQGTQYKPCEAPLVIRKGDILMPETDHDTQVDGDKPHITGKTIEHSTNKGLLTRDTCHLSVGRVTEVGEHQQQHTTDIRPEVCILEHPSSCHSQEDGEDGDNVGMDFELVPQQGKSQTYRTRKVDIEPLFCILRLK